MIPKLVRVKFLESKIEMNGILFDGYVCLFLVHNKKLRDLTDCFPEKEKTCLIEGRQFEIVEYQQSECWGNDKTHLFHSFKIK